MSEPQSEEISDSVGRPPRTAAEHVLANCRPQPAIPAVLIFFLMVLMPAVTLESQSVGSGGWLLWMIGAGIVISCALAIAAGFCSFAPQALWIGLALWAATLFERLELPGALRWLLIAGILSAAGMMIVQLWRVTTGRFVPTVLEPADEDD
jgi:hypothetical protein